MKTGIFLTARLGSSRLPRKHLLPAGSRPMLGILLQRILRAFRVETKHGEVVVVITTSDEAENRAFESFRRDGADVFYGSLHNIPLRHLQAARSLSLDNMVAVDGDDVLCSVNAMRLVRNALQAHSPYVRTVGLPLGMNAFGYSTGFLAESLQGNEGKNLETGWGRIFDDARAADITVTAAPSAPQTLRFTLDYPEDCAFFQALAAHFGERILDVSDDEIIECVIEQRLYELTDPISDRYWNDFVAVRAKEMGAS